MVVKFIHLANHVPCALAQFIGARPDVVHYGNTREDAAVIGFDDAMIYREMKIDPGSRKIPAINLCRSNALKVFEDCSMKPDKTFIRSGARLETGEQIIC